VLLSTTLHSNVAGVWSALPAASTAITEKICDDDDEPSDKPEYVFGLVQLSSHSPPSILHLNFDTSESGLENVNSIVSDCIVSPLDIVFPLPSSPSLAELMTVSGGVVSEGGGEAVVVVAVVGEAAAGWDSS
jgi:hypothetical protein